MEERQWLGMCGLENVNCTQEEAETAHSVQAGPSCRFETPPTPLDAFPAIETTMFVLHAASTCPMTDMLFPSSVYLLGWWLSNFSLQPNYLKTLLKITVPHLQRL